MRLITLSLAALFFSNVIKVQAQTASKFKVVNKTSHTKKEDSSNRIMAVKDSTAILIAQINEQMNAVDDELEEDLEEEIQNNKTYLTEQLINVARDYKGTKYKWGGMSRKGMDCSGFVKTAFDTFDMYLPRTSREMASLGKKVTKANAKPGDLIFFKNGGKRVINHVGIVVEASEDEIKFIHSSTSKGVIVSSTKEAYYRKGFAQINRVYDTKRL